MERNKLASSPRDRWARGSGSSFSQRWTLLEARRWRRRCSGGPLAPIILPTAAEQLGEPPSVLVLVRQALSRHNVGGGSRRKRQLGFRARKGSLGHRLYRGWARLEAQGLVHWFPSIFILIRWSLAWIQRKGRGHRDGERQQAGGWSRMATTARTSARAGDHSLGVGPEVGLIGQQEWASGWERYWEKGKELKWTD
jgi:hypothetical protein